MTTFSDPFTESSPPSDPDERRSWVLRNMAINKARAHAARIKRTFKLYHNHKPILATWNDFDTADEAAAYARKYLNLGPREERWDILLVTTEPVCTIQGVIKEMP